MINKKLGLAVFTSAMLSLSAFAATGTGTSTATIVNGIAISPTQDLAFGKISAGTGGSVSISVAGARSSSGGVVLVNTGSVQTQGQFSVTGLASATYTIALPADSTVTLSDGASHTMAVNSFLSDPAAGANGQLSAGGSQTINVGATLTVSSGQTAGTYTGTYPVIVEYN